MNQNMGTLSAGLEEHKTEASGDDSRYQYTNSDDWPLLGNALDEEPKLVASKSSGKSRPSFSRQLQQPSSDDQPHNDGMADATA